MLEPLPLACGPATVTRAHCRLGGHPVLTLLRCIIDDCGVWVVDTCMSWHAWNAHRRAIQPGYRYRYFMEAGETTPPVFVVPGTAPIPKKRTRCHWGRCHRLTRFWLCDEHRARARGYVQKHRAGAGA